jgi:hypothetical protein
MKWDRFEIVCGTQNAHSCVQSGCDAPAIDVEARGMKILPSKFY